MRSFSQNRSALASRDFRCATTVPSPSRISAATMPASVELRRARPLLGTIVEIRATASDASVATRAIERVHRLMSYHEKSSDIARLNASAAQRPTTVHPWTRGVLRRAIALHRCTRGQFDIAIAPVLTRGGWLPRTAGQRAAPRATCADIVLLPRRRVRFLRPLRIDLGGIAKGYAVDRAIAALRSAGATAGVVNAGGDLRVFGSRSEPVYVREPASPGKLTPLTTLREAALATSAHYFSTRRWRGESCSPVIDPKLRRPSAARLSVSVCARECWLADALCKIVWLAGPAAGEILQAQRARAWVFDPSSRMNAESPDHKTRLNAFPSSCGPKHDDHSSRVRRRSPQSASLLRSDPPSAFAGRMNQAKLAADAL